MEEWHDPRDLNKAAYNPRRITPEGKQGLNQSMSGHGFVGHIIVNRRTGYTVVGGHQRLDWLIEKGWNPVPCIVLDIDRKQEQALNIALNNPEAQGEFEPQKLKELVMLLDMKKSKELMLSTGYSDQRLREILEAKEVAEQDDDEAHYHSKPTTHRCPSCAFEFEPGPGTRVKA